MDLPGLRICPAEVCSVSEGAILKKGLRHLTVQFEGQSSSAVVLLMFWPSHVCDSNIHHRRWFKRQSSEA